MMVKGHEEIFLDDTSDAAYTRDELSDYPDTDFTRYVREDLCTEAKPDDTFLKHLPLFGCHVDPDGNVWVKIPAKVTP